MQTSPSLVPISSHVLTADLPIDVEVFVKPNANAKPVRFCAAGEKPTASQLRDFQKTVSGRLFILRSARQDYQEYLRNNWQALVNDRRRSIRQRVGILGDVVRDVLRDEMRGGDTERIVAESQRLSQTVCDVLIEPDCLAGELYSVLHHDYATFTHSTNVALYCVILAKQMGVPASRLRSVAVGGLLHDVGKVEIDRHLLNKPGGLTVRQYREIKKHPTIGFAALAGRQDIEFSQLMMAYQHHERIDGSGYPCGLLGDEIHDWAKLCAIVDAYEALTAHRPYHKPATPEAAMALLARGRGSAFDPEMLDCWRRLVCTS